MTATAAMPVVAAPAERGAPSVELNGSIVLAARLGAMAQDAARAGQGQSSLETAASLLLAAAKLDSKNPRYPRLLAEVMQREGDPAGVYNALLAQRNNNPADKSAQAAAIDAAVAQQQTADQKLAYLQRIAALNTLDSTVRAHADVALARLYLDRSQDEEADAAIAGAVKLDPDSVDAQQLRYQRAMANGSSYERVNALLDLLRANPAQPARAADLARELAAAGLVRPALDWFQFAKGVSSMGGVPLSHAFAIDYAAELYLADQFASADGIAGQLLALDPSDAEATWLRVICRRTTAATDPKAWAATLDEAKAVFRGRVVAATKPPTTQPAGEVHGPLPDLTTTIDALRPTTEPTSPPADPSQGRRREDLEASLTDLALFDTWLDADVEEATAAIDALGKLLQPDDVTLTRLQGWLFLAQNRSAEARVKLSAVADRDPLAAVGLARLGGANDADKQAAAAAGRQTLGTCPSGLLGALVWDGLRDRGFERMPIGHAEAIIDAVEGFPRAWLRVIERPGDFYQLRAEPMAGAYGYGEPLMARVTLENIGAFDITVGPSGLVHPDLWLDAQLRGVLPADIAGSRGFVPGAGFDRLSGALVLHPRDQITQVVRVDQGPLASVFLQNPTPSFQAYVTGILNPITGPNGNIVEGPGGVRVAFDRPFVRRSFSPFNPTDRKRVFDAADQGTPTEQFASLQLLSAYLVAMNNTAANPPPPAAPPPTAQTPAADAATTNPAAPADPAAQMKALSPDFLGAILRARGDGDAGVAAWANFLAVQASVGAEQQHFLNDMLASKDWATRLLGVIAAESLKGATRTAALQTLPADDPEPIVARLVAAVQSAAPPTPQPTINLTETNVVTPDTGNGPATAPPAGPPMP